MASTLVQHDDPHPPSIAKLIIGGPFQADDVLPICKIAALILFAEKRPGSGKF
jgi:hypothetical protein